MLKYAIVIPNWNGIDLIAECLESLRRQTLPHHVIVVDNGSVDGSNDIVRSQFPEVELLEFTNNAGFAGGVNRGIRPALAAGADYIALLNNDAVAEPIWLAELVAEIERHPEAGIVTSKIRRLDGNRLDSTGDFYTSWGFAYPRGRDEIDTGRYDNQTEVFGCSGGASIYRASMLQQVGLFDEDYFAYYEDVDLSFRAQLMGWKARYAPLAVVNHHVGGTSSKHGTFGRYYTVRNFMYLYIKNMPTPLYWKYLWRVLFSYFMMAGSDVRRRQLGTFARASWSGLIHLPKMIAKRRTIQRTKTVSAAYIDSILMHQMPPTQQAYLKVLRRLHIPNTTKS